MAPMAAAARARAVAVVSRSNLASSSSLHAVRSIHSTRAVKAAESSASSSSAEDEYPPEGFTSPIWGYTLLAGLAGAGIYRLSTLHADPHPSRASSSGRSAPGNESDDELPKPWLTRYIEHWTTPSSVWKERNLRHLEMAREKAEERLLLQDAERPPVHRLRFPQTFEQASPHNIAPGTQADLSGLKIKRSSE
ncbi:uncharacterized protein PFL1_02997 [Pseudozyma flocculosa PF-1]|uniref:Uncharacterized protein n=2 Tax=Pseudozyma flocculosa TaxID=84751 RepID=A0A5C3F391_9BASI|nr:uncharacterized protein PFL1_02997 [Pseudozyma flocculosa PF-1]EPQ29242.1 hypothetical protein PFL1_02997 [Pseudozyma flocculosa PF-1]SPO37741.1 uncharacterized protein PSFLO_03217 [Pseudozyma flocculosa]